MAGQETAIPPEIAFQARYPGAAGQEPPPESGYLRTVRPGFCLLMTPMPTVNLVEDVSVAPAQVGDAVEEVRGLLRARGRGQAAWVVPASAGALLESLSAAGMTPYDDPPLGRLSTAMALLHSPAGSASPDVVVREAVDLQDYLDVAALAAVLFEMGHDDSRALAGSLRARHALRQQGRTPMRTYLAFVDGRLVGQGQGTETQIATNLSGSSVEPAARGRGVYRALVVARWDDAVSRGLPALTVQAGEMSRPILARLGFEVVEVESVLCDRFAPAGE